MVNLKGKTAIVTGASRGIGATIAIKLAEAGVNVVINYNGNKSKAEEAAKKIDTLNGKAIIVQADVSKFSEVEKLFDSAIQHFGNVDILVNNAGIMKNNLIQNATDNEFNQHFEINVRGVFNMLKQASTKLAENGSIINFSSTTTKLMMPTYGLYSASKAAVEQMSRVFAKEVGVKGLNVNAVLTGTTNTALFKEGKSEELIKNLAAMTAFKRIGEPEDIAKTVIFLSSDDAKWITRQSIATNGGLA
ncbi:MAG: SDR family oxidoreductase [Arcicella sp.]|jgi:3-oxoacyl-[acyl-carrier protein] reductase|nr:SDR family oxidoreductase [Arcicella sp.]